MSLNVWSLVKPKIRHIVALVIFLLLMLSILYVVVTNNDSYQEAYRFIVNDSRVATELGEVKRVDFEFWHDFEFSSFGNNGHADYSFSVTTKNGVFHVETQLQIISGIWKVTAANIRLTDGRLKHITL